MSFPAIYSSQQFYLYRTFHWKEFQNCFKNNLFFKKKSLQKVLGESLPTRMSKAALCKSLGQKPITFNWKKGVQQVGYIYPKLVPRPTYQPQASIKKTVIEFLVTINNRVSNFCWQNLKYACSNLNWWWRCVCTQRSLNTWQAGLVLFSKNQHCNFTGQWTIHSPLARSTPFPTYRGTISGGKKFLTTKHHLWGELIKISKSLKCKKKHL